MDEEFSIIVVCENKWSFLINKMIKMNDFWYRIIRYKMSLRGWHCTVPDVSCRGPVSLEEASVGLPVDVQESECRTCDLAPQLQLNATKTRRK